MGTLSDPALWGLGFLAGVVTGVSPCILPVMPVVFASWAASPVDVERPMAFRRRRAVAVVAGLVVGFTTFTLGGLALLKALHLPDDLIEHVGLGLLALIGLGLLVPPLERLIEAPYRRLRVRPPSGRGPGFLLGLALGAVFFPCAGPVLVAITTAADHMNVGVSLVVLTVCFAAGAALPLMSLALAGDAIVERNRRLKELVRRLRPVAGAILILVSATVFFNWFSALQRDVPGFVNAIGGTCADQSSLARVSGTGTRTCVPPVAGLKDYGAAPNFTGITAWLNTPGRTPVTLASLRGQVVLVDFWTYSCINCQRELPHVEAWYAAYHHDGFTVIGVEAPEFAFEHVVSNVAAADRALGVHYPVAVDDNLATWAAYHNNYWPAEYVIDPSGTIVHEHFGEGDYTPTETLIRNLLLAAHPDTVLPARTDTPNLTPNEDQSPETYLGYNYPQSSEFLQNGLINPTATGTYALPDLTDDYGYYLGGRWKSDSESLVAEGDSQIALHYLASDVYLVIGGTGTVNVTLDGVTRRISVSGYPRLYTLVAGTTARSDTVTAHFSPGLRAYDFTFG